MKETVGSYPQLDILWLNRQKMMNGFWQRITWSNDFGSKISLDILIHKYDNFLELHDNYNTHTIALETTDCYFGGKRYWFTCPHCKRRKGILHIIGYQIACRECFKLTYWTCQARRTRTEGLTRELARYCRLRRR